MKRLVSTARRVRSNAFWVRVNGSYECVRLGSDYGGWHVIGDLVNEESVVYSFGIGEDISFDLALIGSLGVTIHAFDPTPRSLEWIREQETPPSFNIYPFGIAAFDGNARFSPPENPCHVSYTMKATAPNETNAVELPVERLETIMKELGHDHIDLLKMDIEGAE